MSAEPRDDDRTRRPARPPTAADAPRVDPPLHARIERTQLRLRVAALERALETSEHRRQAIIDRYEELLADREGAAEPSAAESQRDSSLRRLLEAWP